MNPLALIPLKDWLYFAAVLAFAGFVAWGVHHERGIGYAHGAAEVQARWDKAIKRDQAAKDAEIKRVAVAQKEVDHEAEKFQALADVGAAHAGDALDRLQHRFAALGPCGVSGAASAAEGGASAAAGDGRDVRADVLRVVGEAAKRLAARADRSRGAGLDAEGHYDALIPPPVKGTP